MAANNTNLQVQNELANFVSEPGSEYEETCDCAQEGGELKAKRKTSGLRKMSEVSKNILEKMNPLQVIPQVIPQRSPMASRDSKRRSSARVNTEALANYLKMSLGASRRSERTGGDISETSSEAVSNNNSTTLAAASLEAVDINPEQKQWEAFSTWLQSFNLIKQTLPFECPVAENPPPPVPAWGSGNSMVLKRVTIKKRFNSRKQPHLVEFENVDGMIMQMIYKQDDDISMDVSVMKLFEMCNEAWARRGMFGYLKTYKVVACPDLTGFGEIVPGGTMLQYHTADMVNQLGNDKDNWLRLTFTLVAVLVVTAIFDITDRHHNNVLFTPDCELALIDLSASLGKEAPMDKALRINPIYYPERIKNLREIYNKKVAELGGNPETDMRRWQDLEEAAIAHYFAIYNDYTIAEVLKAVNYKMLKPHKFHLLLHERKHRKQVSEGIRNDIVGAMDENDTINSIVAGISRVIPMN